NVRPSLIGSLIRQVLPPSVVRSKCTRQPSCSVLLGQRMVPSASSSGLFFTGPISGWPFTSPSFCCLLQVRPLSWETHHSPHHCRGLGPTLKNSIGGPLVGWNSTGFQHGYRNSADWTPSATI